MTVDELAAVFPTLYHMAEFGTWPGIRERGLLSTSALLDRFEIKGDERRLIEECRRPESVRISHRQHGEAVIRDQKPMSETALRKCLRGMSPTEWYRHLNARVFFWLTETRLQTLLKAKAYRARIHCVLTIDTAALLKKHAAKATLSPINSGSTVYSPQTRGAFTFARISDYPFEEWRTKRGRQKAIAELAIDYAVPDIRDFVSRVAHMKETNEVELIQV